MCGMFGKAENNSLIDSPMHLFTTRVFMRVVEGGTDCLFGRAGPKLEMQKAHSEELRVSTDMAVRANSAPPKQDLPIGALRVLVAEDNLVNQKVLQKVLQRVTPDSPIFIANNGQEALKVVLTTPFPETLKA